MVNSSTESRSTSSTIPAFIIKPNTARKISRSTTDPLDFELRARSDNMSSTGPLTKPKRRLSKATSPSSPIRNSFSHPHTISQSSSSSSITTVPHTRSHSNSFSTFSNNHNNVNDFRDRDQSFATTSATATSSPVTNLTYSFNGSMDANSHPVNPNRPHHSSLHHHNPYHNASTASYNSPTFPGLTEDYEPSSSGRSSNDTPVVLQTSTFPTIVNPNEYGSQPRYQMGEPGLVKAIESYGYKNGRLSDRGRTIVPSEALLSASNSKDSSQLSGQSPGPLKIMGVDIKWISLTTLALQNAFLTIIMHYSRISTSPSRSYSAASAVLLNELLKGSISLLTALKRVDNDMTKEESHLRSPVAKSRTGTPNMSDHSLSGHNSVVGTPRSGKVEAVRNFVLACFKADRWRRLSKEIFSPDCWKLSIPAILYVIQNNLQYTAASNLDVATFQVTYQMKILTTAFFSVFMLGKRLTTSKWLALLLLAAGVGIVQIQNGASPGTSSSTNIVEKVGELAAESDVVAAVHEMSPFKGFAAVCAACVTSGLAGVYFEMVLKGSKADLWVRNAQLSLFSLIPALLPILLGSARSNSGGGLAGILLEPFKNFSAWAWGTVLTQVLGGLITALVIKYSDNILKGFATSLSIILSSMASVILFNYRITPAFVMGSSIVLSATFMYNQPANNKPNPLVAGLANKIAEATGGKVDPSSSRGRTSVAVPGSPIPANAPIIGETPKPSRSSSVVSLLGLGQSLSRAPTPSLTNGQSRTTTPYLTAHTTPNVLSPFGSMQNLAALNSNRPPPPPPLSRASSNYSIRSMSGSEANPGFGSLQSLTPSTSPTSARDRKHSGRHRPVLEVNTDVEVKTK